MNFATKSASGIDEIERSAIPSAFGPRMSEGTAATNIEPCVGHGEDHVAARLQQFRHGSLGAEHVTLDVNAEELVERLAQLVIRDFDEWERVVPNSGVANEAVEPAELACSARDGVAVVVDRGYVAGYRLDRIAEFRFQPLVALFRAIENADPRTFLDEARDDRTAESRRAAGYECNFAVKPAHPRVFRSFALSRCFAARKRNSDFARVPSPDR